MYNSTHYYVRVSRAETFTGWSLASWVELPEVLDVPSVRDGDPVMCFQACGSRPSVARLETRDGIPIQNAWNIQHLRKFYP